MSLKSVNQLYNVMLVKPTPVCVLFVSNKSYLIFSNLPPIAVQALEMQPLGRKWGIFFSSHCECFVHVEKNFTSDPFCPADCARRGNYSLVEYQTTPGDVQLPIILTRCFHGILTVGS